MLKLKAAITEASGSEPRELKCGVLELKWSEASQNADCTSPCADADSATLLLFFTWAASIRVECVAEFRHWSQRSGGKGARFSGSRQEPGGEDKLPHIIQ